MKIHPIILCGGSGTRLWPVSRQGMPKQFVPLMGEFSTFQLILQLVKNDAFCEPLVVAQRKHHYLLTSQLAACQMKASLMLEPEGRDSAPAIASAIEHIVAQYGMDALCLILSSDQKIADLSGADFIQAISVANLGHIVTFGIAPTCAEPGYGYLKPGEAIAGDICILGRFVEKPSRDSALEYINRGYLINSGNLLCQAGVMQAEIAAYEPEIASTAAQAYAEASRLPDESICLAPVPYGYAPKKSIDYAVMERTRYGAIMPLVADWSDVGTWARLWQVSERDVAGNAIRGEGRALESTNCQVYADDILTMVVGVSNLSVVSTKDAILVVHHDYADQVKQLVEPLCVQKYPQVFEHMRTYRPWGYYQSVERGARYQVKRLVVRPGEALSMQKHFHRAEHWIVVRGTAAVELDDTQQLVHENQSIYLPMGATHRLSNPGKIDLELIEVQTGSYLGEDDIVRFESGLNLE